jgi:plastocyanin
MPERFYGAGEERAQLFLPGGYGYPMNKNDAWGMTYMVMNHRKTTDQAYVKYTITYDTGAYTPVKPYWLDEENCKVDPIYNVRGGARKGTLDRRTVDVRMRESGRLVAGGGHVHGGAKRLELSRPDCSAKPIARSLPTWGAKNHPFYKVRPVLHEPGPINMTGFLSAGGIPVAKGERLRLSSIYDARDPHVRVMGIFVVYVAPGAANAPKCAPVPRDVWNSPRPKGRYTAPRWPIPLTGLNADGRAVTIKAPPGKLKRLRSGATVKLRSFRFGTRNVLLKKGAKLRWKFLDTGQSGLHNVTLANGPEAIGTDNLNDGRTAAFRFRRKGTYRLFCALHPVLMSERVVVR